MNTVIASGQAQPYFNKLSDLTNLKGADEDVRALLFMPPTKISDVKS